MCSQPLPATRPNSGMLEHQQNRFSSNTQHKAQHSVFKILFKSCQHFFGGLCVLITQYIRLYMQYVNSHNPRKLKWEISNVCLLIWPPCHRVSDKQQHYICLSWSLHLHLFKLVTQSHSLCSGLAGKCVVYRYIDFFLNLRNQDSGKG